MPDQATPKTTKKKTAKKKPKTRKRTTRRDQYECPKCGRRGCPASGGTRRAGTVTKRYRMCSACGHRFQTRQPLGGHEEICFG